MREENKKEKIRKINKSTQSLPSLPLLSVNLSVSLPILLQESLDVTGLACLSINIIPLS